MANIKVKNKKTEVEREFTDEQWKAVKANKLLDGVFVQVKGTKTPPEVKEIEERKTKAEEKAEAKAKAEAEAELTSTNGNIASPLKAEK